MDYSLIYACGIITGSFFIQGVFGFGGGLIAVPLLSFITDPKTSVTLVMLFQVLVGGLIFPVRNKIDWPTLGKILPWLFLGVLLGLFFLQRVSSSLISQILGTYLIVYALVSAAKLSKKLGTLTANMAMVSGVTSGFIQGLFGTGGPMLVTYLREKCPEQTVFRASVIAGLFILNIIRLCVSFPSGMLSHSVLDIALPTAPFVLIALFVGHHLSGRIKPFFFEVCVLILLASSGVGLLIR
ncbi:MAG: hypothetical protein RL518_2265 [Pseudomonadota bacterium]|jgi:uncharacterized membrane protein YfcA